MSSSKSLVHPSITKFLKPKEDSLSDRDFDVFNLVLSVSNLSHLEYQII